MGDKKALVPAEIIVRKILFLRGEKVLLILTHRRVKPEELCGAFGGWHTHFDILAAVLAGEKPPAFWRLHTELEAEYASRLAHT